MKNELKSPVPSAAATGSAQEALVNIIAAWDAEDSQEKNDLSETFWAAINAGRKVMKVEHEHEWHPQIRYSGGWRDVCVTCGAYRNSPNEKLTHGPNNQNI